MSTTTLHFVEEWLVVKKKGKRDSFRVVVEMPRLHYWAFGPYRDRKCCGK
jgi:hypothetical protein